MSTIYSLPKGINRRNFSLAALCTGAGLRASFAQTAPVDEVWADTQRNRELPVLIRWPQGKPLGVMVYSHGLGGHREGGDVWGKAWAAAGLLVLHVQHPGSDAPSLKGGFSALRKATAPEQFTARVQDIKFVVDELRRRQAQAQSAEWAQVPVNQLAIGGHSFGARTSLALAGWARAGNAFSEPRAKAFVALSPALGAGVSPEQARKELATCSRPMLVVSGSLDGEVLSNGETVEGRRLVYDALPVGKKSLLWLSGADHMSFGGNSKRIPSTMIYKRSNATLDAEPKHHEVVARTSAAWLLAQLTGRTLVSPQGLGAADVWLTE